MSKPVVTVTICTFHRADLLPTTLDSLAAAQQPKEPWELLIVDNGCEDAVAKVVEQFKDKLPVRYESESSVGIARARNKAALSAAAPIILYADDDVLFDKAWLVNMLRTIREHADCVFWGGRIHPVWEIQRPAWFDEARCPMLGDSVVKYDLGDQPRAWNPDNRTIDSKNIPGDPPFYTANLALRVQSIKDAGMFDVTLGHKGKKRGTGEDSWMIKTLHRTGGKGWYAADAVLYHPVEAKRLTRPYARRFAWRQGAISVEMLRRENNGRAPRWLYRLAFTRTVSGLGQWLAGAIRFNPPAAFSGQYSMIFNFSKLRHALFK